MATIGEVIYNIKSLRDGGEFSKDHKLGNRQLEFIVDTVRAKIAAYSEMGKLSIEGYLQELEGAKLISTNDFRTHTRGVVIMEVANIPDVITADGFGKLFNFVGTRDDFQGFQKTTPAYFSMDLTQPLVHSVYFTANDKLYVATKRHFALREVYVRAVFASPRKVLEFNNDTNANNFEWRYPTPQNFVQQLNAELVKNELMWMNMLPPDDKNDGRDKKGTEI